MTPKQLNSLINQYGRLVYDDQFVMIPRVKFVALVERLMGQTVAQMPKPKPVPKPKA